MLEYQLLLKTKTKTINLNFDVVQNLATRENSILRLLVFFFIFNHLFKKKIVPVEIQALNRAIPFSVFHILFFITFLPMPLAGAWVNRWTFSSLPPPLLLPPLPHLQSFVYLRYRTFLLGTENAMGGMGLWLSMPSCLLQLQTIIREDSLKTPIFVLLTPPFRKVSSKTQRQHFNLFTLP